MMTVYHGVRRTGDLMVTAAQQQQPGGHFSQERFSRTQSVCCRCNCIASDPLLGSVPCSGPRGAFPAPPTPSRHHRCHCYFQHVFFLN